jgi:hypothetical protein
MNEAMGDFAIDSRLIEFAQLIHSVGVRISVGLGSWRHDWKRVNEMIDWQPFLAHWSRELMQSELAGQVAPPPSSPEWLGFVAATAEEVAELGQRLGLILPPS